MDWLRYLIIGVPLLFISGCQNVDPVVYDRTGGGQWAQQIATEVFADTGMDEIAFEALIRTLAHEAMANWGDQKSASRREYVKYTNNYRTRVFVNFDHGKIHVETLDRSNLRAAIVETLLTPDDPSQVDLFSASDVPTGKEPVLYGQVVDHQGQPIRWPWRAEKYADYLLQNQLSRRTGSHGTVYAVDFDLVQNHMQQRQYQYASLVKQHPRKYAVEESLIYAIMRTESSFNPYAVSPANAYGLMQVVPATAGRDVFRLVHGRRGQPSRPLPVPVECLQHIACTTVIG